MLRRCKSPSSIGIDCKGFERGRFPQTLASPREPKRTLQSKFGTRSPKKKPNEEANDRQLLGFYNSGRLGTGWHTATAPTAIGIL